MVHAKLFSWCMGSCNIKAPEKWCIGKLMLLLSSICNIFIYYILNIFTCLSLALFTNYTIIKTSTDTHCSLSVSFHNLISSFIIMCTIISPKITTWCLSFFIFINSNLKIIMTSTYFIFLTTIFNSTALNLLEYQKHNWRSVLFYVLKNV